MNKMDQLRIKLMRKLVKTNKDKIIIDVGGGLHQISKNLASKKTIILDGDPALNPDVLVDLNKEIPLKENFADIIIAGEILEHLINPFKFILELKRILKKDGEIILSTPNIVCLKSRIKVLFGKLPTNCAKAFPTKENTLFFHKVDFNWKSLEEIFKKAGLKIISKKNTGVFLGGKLIIPPKLCPLKLGEKFILKVKK